VKFDVYLPCPLCGSKAVQDLRENGSIAFPDRYVMCTFCSCEALEDDWNNRVQPVKKEGE
jgi:formate dehydrogenase maturation protein FdhE